MDPEPEPEPVDPEPEPEPVDPEPPALPEGAPPVTSTSVSWDGLRVSISVVVEGPPGTSVVGVINGVQRASTTVGDDGTATLTVRPTLVELLSTLDVSYALGDARGPSHSLDILSLVLSGALAEEAPPGVELPPAL